MSEKIKQRQHVSALVVFVLLSRPGGGTGGAEASPPRVRARGAAPEPTCWRRHGAAPGAERGVEKTHGEASRQLQSEHLGAKQLSGDEPRLRPRGPGERADSAARGAQAPHPPSAAAAWLAKTTLAFSARMASSSRFYLSALCSWGTWSTWSAVISLTSRAGELRSAPSGPDDWHRGAGKRALAQGVRVRGERAV